jgi:hypothetical protein
MGSEAGLKWQHERTQEFLRPVYLLGALWEISIYFSEVTYEQRVVSIRQTLACTDRGNNCLTLLVYTYTQRGSFVGCFASVGCIVYIYLSFFALSSLSLRRSFFLSVESVKYTGSHDDARTQNALPGGGFSSGAALVRWASRSGHRIRFTPLPQIDQSAILLLLLLLLLCTHAIVSPRLFSFLLSI